MWGEVSGLVFRYVGGPISKEQANIRIITDGVNINRIENVLADAEPPLPFETPPSSEIRLDSFWEWKAFAVSPDDPESGNSLTLPILLQIGGCE